MPFDPDYPQGGAPMDPAAMRAQLNALHEEITTIPQGPEGPPGPPGGEGPPGPAFAATVVDAVFTVPFGDPATVTTSFDGSAVHFTFQIPAGQPGATGETGAAGEVSAVQLADAVAGTSANTNSVATLDTAFTNDPLSLADGELLRAKINELILSARR